MNLKFEKNLAALAARRSTTFRERAKRISMAISATKINWILSFFKTIFSLWKSGSFFDQDLINQRKKRALANLVYTSDR